METKSSKRFVGSVINLWSKYDTDIFFRATCNIIALQVVLTTIVISGLWFVMEYVVRDTSQTLISTFAQMLQGKIITADDVTTQLAEIHVHQFWPIMVGTTAIILSFGFIMVYISLTQARRSLERKKRFVSNIAHEVRTPLAVIRTNTDVAMLDENMLPKFRNVLKRNIVELDKISEIMNTLMSLSRFIRDAHIKFENVDLSIVSKRAVNSLAEIAERKSVTLNIKSLTNQTVYGNASALEQVAFNLVKNAISHGGENGIVTIEINLDGKYVTLSVSDTGGGIARDDLFHIFEPFYRTRRATSSSGYGLGLSIVNEIVNMHGGKIKVRSTLGRGTTVTVCIKKSLTELAPVKSGDLKDIGEVAMDFSQKTLP